MDIDFKNGWKTTGSFLSKWEDFKIKIIPIMKRKLHNIKAKETLYEIITSSELGGKFSNCNQNVYKSLYFKLKKKNVLI